MPPLAVNPRGLFIGRFILFRRVFAVFFMVIKRQRAFRGGAAAQQHGNHAYKCQYKYHDQDARGIFLLFFAFTLVQGFVIVFHL